MDARSLPSNLKPFHLLMEPFQAVFHLQAFFRCLIDAGRALNAFQKAAFHQNGKIILGDNEAGIGSIDYSGYVLTILAHAEDLHNDLIFASARPHFYSSQRASEKLPYGMQMHSELHP